MILNIILVQACLLFYAVVGEEEKDHALFYRRASQKKVRESKKVDVNDSRNVEDILSWLQTRYKEVNRKVRNEDPSRAYLPANLGSSTQEPRPFQTPKNIFQIQSTIQPPFQTQEKTQKVYQQTTNEYQTGLPKESVSEGYSQQQNQNGFTTQRQYSTPKYQQNTNGYTTSNQNGYQTQKQNQNGYQTTQRNQNGYQAKQQNQNGYQTTQRNQNGYQAKQQNQNSYPTQSQQGFQTQQQQNQNFQSQEGQDQQGFQPLELPNQQGFQSQSQNQNSQLSQNGFETQQPLTPQEGDSVQQPGLHPPHIHALNVDCSKDKMTVDLEFNEPYNGIVYSKGHHNSPECRHVQPNSGQSKYTFTLYLDTCGTQFIDGFSKGESAYLENTLVIQNEPGILEVWDSVRSVRCLWEGSIDQSLRTGLMINSLNQELVTFSGDTGKARLEIQAGRGPYATGASELVQIGDLMTLLVTVDGDEAFQLRVGECRGTDGVNSVELTDTRGCPLKEKLMAGFQYSRHQQTGAALAYAYFRAFKFPDVMDLTMECNVQLCKTDCRPPCDDPNQKFEPSRRRRSVNDTEGMLLARTIRVFLPEDIPDSLPSHDRGELCLTKKAFFGSTIALSVLALLSGVAAAFYWAKNQKKSPK